MPPVAFVLVLICLAVAFIADDVKRTYEELSKRGVEFSGPPQFEEWGTFVIFKDSDGNGFVLGSK